MCSMKAAQSHVYDEAVTAAMDNSSYSYVETAST